MRLFINWVYILPFLDFKMIGIVFSVPGLIGVRDNSLNPWLKVDLNL